MDDWLADHPDVRTIRTAVADLNGQARGKRMPARLAGKVFSDGARMPLSTLNVDILGEDIEDSPLVFETGDRDGVLKPTERGFVPVPWLDTPTAMLPVWMYQEDGAAFAGDPRHALAKVLDRYRDRGWTVVAATELEFYLVDDSDGSIRPPRSPRSGKRPRGADILSLGALDGFDAFLTALYDACEAMEIPAETAISESGTGQFEINLAHGPALRAADDAWLFKLLVKGLARKHGMAASFMAKPYEDQAGTGMHVHFSVLDRDGENVFNDGTDAGSDVLRAGIAGCLEAIPDSTLIFAPHANSYERLVPGAHAPTGLCWAYENRTAAIRVPAGPGKARRIEHRVSGGDINPYLLLAAVLGAALTGIEDGLEPPPPITGSAYEMALPQIPDDWAVAVSRFETSGLMKRIFPRELVRNLALTKRQEMRIAQGMDRDELVELYLDRV